MRIRRNVTVYGLGRVGFLDELRGLCVILMVIYHGMYNLIFIFNIAVPLFDSQPMLMAQRFFMGLFVVISGISCRYSKSNLKRGLKAFAIALAITAVSIFAMPGQAIYFGVLHFLGTGMILYGLLHRHLDELPAFFGFFIMIILAVFTWGIPRGTVGLPWLFTLELPRFLYDVGFLFPLGFVGSGFSSADYVPIFPWIFVYLAATYFGMLFTEGHMPAAAYRTHSSTLAFVGRKALIIYVLHQPILLGLMFLIFNVLLVN